MAGFLLRLSYRLRLTPHRVATLCGLACRSDSIPQEQLRGLPADTARKFARAAHLTDEEVEGLTLRGFTASYPPLAKLRACATSAPGLKSHVNWATNPVGRYCPQCLAGDGSTIQSAFGGPWQLRWHLPIVFACTVHRQLLECACPHCAQPLTGRVIRRYNLLQLPHVPGLHPLQCRSPAPGLPRAPRARNTPCGGRLDVPAASTTVLHEEDLERVLSLQHYLNLNLESGQQRGSAGAADRSFFPDLVLTAHLVTLTWPLGAAFLPSSALADLVDAHISDSGARSGAGFAARRSAPGEPARSAALLVAADTVLGNRTLASLRERIEPLTREAYRRSTSIADKLFTRSDVSAVLLRAAAPRIHGFQRRVANRYSLPGHLFRIEEVPPLLPQSWLDVHFPALTQKMPRMTRRLEHQLRQGGSLRLAELACGRKWRDCAPALGIPAGSAKRTMNVLGRELADSGLWLAFEESVDRVARDLDACDKRIDYARRRRLTADWKLTTEDWQRLCAGLPRLEQLAQKGDPRLGEAVVWSAVNQASYLCSPALTSRRTAPTTENLVRQVTVLYNPDRCRRSRRMLLDRLQRHAERLATACDQGLDLPISVAVQEAPQ